MNRKVDAIIHSTMHAICIFIRHYVTRIQGFIQLRSRTVDKMLWGNILVLTMLNLECCDLELVFRNCFIFQYHPCNVFINTVVMPSQRLC